MNHLKLPRSGWLAMLGVMLLATPLRTLAQQQQQGLCAQIKMEIDQQLTMERIGFLATLQITDNDGTDPITGFAANLTFENRALSTNGVANDASSLFFVQPPTLQNISDVAGGGIISPGQTATVSWFIIPTTSAGGTSALGTVYQVAATLSGKIRGVDIPAATLTVYPAPITVAPDAQLDITYFQPRDVTGDDPFTPQVESPVPFTFGVIVKNVGYGAAHHVMINSEQPKIVQNKQNLLLVAQLLGSRVNDSPLANANLNVNLGDLQPGQAAKGAWDMITTLSGTFLSINATYTHSPALGGAETSLIKSLNAYLFLHEVLNDQPGRDSAKDFLADMTGALDSIGNLIPDTMFESQGNTVPVNLLTNAVVAGSGNPFQVNLTADFAGWGYMCLTDPGQAKLHIGSVVRSDGKVLNTNNYWTSIHYEPITNYKDTYLNIFDLVALGNYTYTVSYTNLPTNTNAPVTTLNFAGPSTLSGGIYYIAPETQMYFISSDASPVSIYYSLTNGPFIPGYPFSLPVSGQYTVTYYATDSDGNRETNHTATLVVAGSGSLNFAGVNISTQPLFAPGDALSIRPGSVPIRFQASQPPTQVNAEVDIFQGAVGWATVAGVPSSPTSANTATLTVGGDNVDFYQYQLNHGDWSAERPVGSPFSLSGLAQGTNLVAVLGRSAHGVYLDPTNAVVVSWVVSSSAVPTLVTGTPATPNRSGSAQLTVGGAGVTAYRWTTNNGFYRAETPVATPLIITNLMGAITLDVIGKTNGVYQSSNAPTTVQWTINPLYGYDLGSLAQVRSVPFTNIGSAPQTFNWDGRSDAGVLLSPGWYTVRVTITDVLGHTNFATSLAQIGEFSGATNILADFVRGPKNPHARGRWAVWEDQSDGNWEIYAQDISVTNGLIVQVTTNSLSQENPRTDGRYVAWQGRAVNGNWDVFVKDLESSAPARPVTLTFNQDEIKPAIDWPWVVAQNRLTANTTGPWLLMAYNLATGQSFQVSPSTQDELDPDVQGGRVVWQDFRDVGPGEIYLKDLEGGLLRRVTTNLFGQYHPVIYDHWIVWQDNRNLQTDLYGFDLLKNREVQITSTPENESSPYLSGSWVICAENSLGPQAANARLIHLPSLRTIPVTRSTTFKNYPALAAGQAVWQETSGTQTRIISAQLPALQPVFQNQNAVAVTPAMVAYAQNAYGLLQAWQSNGVQQITWYTALTPAITTQTASLVNGSLSGVNFNLTPGSFLWVKFDGKAVLDLGLNTGAPLNLAAGANVFGYTRFPNSYSAYQMLNQLGLGNALAVRMLDSRSGLWQVAEVRNGALVGTDFPIPNVAVIMVDVANPVNQFTPQGF